MLWDLWGYLAEPIVVLSGTPVSAVPLALAIVIIVAARVISGVLARSLGTAFSRRGVADGVGFAVTKITRWLGTIVGVFVALTTIGVNMNAALAAMAVLLVGIGFGLQKMAENFISGLILLIERPVRVGDFISVDGHVGTVVDIGLRATRVVTRDGFTVVVPNGDLITKSVTNYMTPTEALRIWVDIGVAYGSDLGRVRRLLLEVAAAEPMVQAEPAPDVLHRGFGDSSLDLSLVVWIARAPDDVVARSKLRFAIDAAFRANDVVIPFPQRDLYIKQAPPGRDVS